MKIGGIGAIGVHWGGDWGHLGPRGATEVKIGGHWGGKWGHMRPLGWNLGHWGQLGGGG